MAFIKLVTNGDSTNQFRAVSLGHVVSIVFGLVSIIGAQQTWMWAAAHERELIVSSLRLQIVSDIERHAIVDDRRFIAIEKDIERLQNTCNLTTATPCPYP